MIRSAALCASLCLLSACATPSLPARTIDRPAAQTPDPGLCAPVPRTPSLPDGAAVVRPASEAERAGLATFLEYVADLYATARMNETRAAEARAYLCPVVRPG
jgi:hypothetical protein